MAVRILLVNCISLQRTGQGLMRHAVSLGLLRPFCFLSTVFNRDGSDFNIRVLGRALCSFCSEHAST